MVWLQIGTSIIFMPFSKLFCCLSALKCIIIMNLRNKSIILNNLYKIGLSTFYMILIPVVKQSVSANTNNLT